MVEAIANGVEDRLIEGLSFKMQPGASYIVDRRSVTYHPQGSNMYKPVGTKLIRILLTGNDWLDASTFRIMFNLNNDSTDPAKLLYSVGGPWCFFRRMRVLAAGQLVEDVDNYNRIHEMFSSLTASESKANSASEAFGRNWDSENLNMGINFNPGIKGNQSLAVMFKPLSGLLNQGKMLPLRVCPITIELELVDNYLEPIVDPAAGTDGFTATNTSTEWSISNVQVKTDTCTLDNALDNSYTKHLLDGLSLPISYNTFVSQLQTISGQTAPMINVSRALTRLKSVFVTLHKDSADNGVTRKFWNNFFSPMQPDNTSALTHNSDGEFEFQLQIGSKLFPEYPVRSHNEAYYQLCKTLGVQSSAVHNFDISAREFRSSKFVLGTDCEKVLDAGFTGLNTRAGDLMSVKLKYNNSSANRLADRMHIVLHSDQILEIKDSGCSVYD